MLNNPSLSPDLTMQFIHNTQDLVQFCQTVKTAPAIAVDTEFVRDKTFYPTLCLIQIASHDALACIDPLAIDDLSALKSLLQQPEQIKIFHAAKQDLEVLYTTLGDIPKPVFDTQIAATLLGLGEQIGYANLVKHFLTVNLSKQHARTDWEQRPLSDEQLAYAADDVRYLIQIYPLMVKQLSELERLDWLTADFASLADIKSYDVPTEQLWQKVSGNQKLRRKQLSVLRELTRWREQQAKQQNKPRKWIIPDNLLIALAIQHPTKPEQLKKIRGLNQSIVDRFGTTLIKCIQAGLNLPESQWPNPTKRTSLTKQQEAMFDSLMAIVKLKAHQHTLNASALATRQQIEQFLLNPTDSELLQGWRHKLVGEDLLNFIQGHLSLQFNQQQLCLSPIK